MTANIGRLAYVHLLLHGNKILLGYKTIFYIFNYNVSLSVKFFTGGPALEK